MTIVLLAPAVGDAGRGSRIKSLRAHDVAVSADRHAAVLRLYALDSQLTRARGRADSVARRLLDVRRERASLALQLGVARQGVTRAEHRLAKRLRLLYEEREVDPVEILFGARTLDDAISTLDNLGHAAALDRRVVAQLRSARAALGALDRNLRLREAALVRLHAQAQATADALDAGRRERASYLDGLTREQRVTRQALATLERQARRAERRAARLRSVAPIPASAQVVSTTDTAPPPDAAPPTTSISDPVPAPQPTPAPDGARTITVVATGYSIHGSTATGLPTGWGVAAVDPSVIALGTRMTVPGYGEAVAADVGSGIRGASIDLWFPTVADALAWGRRTVTIVLH